MGQTPEAFPAALQAMMLDTNILIAYLNGDAKVVSAVSAWKQEGRALFISAVTVAEVLALPTLARADIEKVRTFLHNFISVPFDNTVAETAAQLRRTYRLLIPDAGIAATAVNLNAPLVTRDRQFRKIREITVVAI